MLSLTHIPKTITDSNGVTRTVYVRTAETQAVVERQRLGLLWERPAWVGGGYEGQQAATHLVVQARQEVAERVMRARLDYDQRPHRILSGVELLGAYFHENEGFRGAFPKIVQLFLYFGYLESTNKLLHQLVYELMALRRLQNAHCWLLIPKSLKEMAIQWGDAFLNLEGFPYLSLVDGHDDGMGPVSVAAPAALVPVVGGVVAEGHGWTEVGGSGGNDPKFAKRDRRRRW